MDITKEEMHDWLHNPITRHYKKVLQDESNQCLEAIIQNIDTHFECLKLSGQRLAYLNSIKILEELEK